ncbi:protein disulfide isomerase [Scheffersomyces amazonensis]|uniref:protein disulfide isomerase n=1 Tax=Scheffersomyces amazonensis TaxID=1078765 RepID=UPI00315C8249
MKWSLISGLVLSALIVVVDCYSTSSNLIQVDDKTFKSIVIDSGKYVFVDFYADWCRHCAKLMPTIEELADLFEPYPEIQIVKINGDKDGKKMAKKHVDVGFPTLKLFHGSDQPIEFEGSRDLVSLSNFIQLASGIRIEQHQDIKDQKQQILNNLENEESVDNIVKLNDFNFDEKVIESNIPHHIVVYSATWCKYCQEVKPIIEAFANRVFANDKDIVQFGIIEKDIEPAEKLGDDLNIDLMPTIMHFTKGNRTPTYIKSRDYNGLLKTVNELTGIYRNDDGKLLENAGKIEELDELIQKRLEGVKYKTTEAVNLLSELKNYQDFSTIDYYKKLLNKIINGEEEFFKLELSRLNNILEKDISKLKGSTIDSMQRRSNILKQFINKII